MTSRHSSTLILALGLVTGSAHAQSQGFALDRFEPSERGSDWFTNESLDLRGNQRPSVGVVGDWAYRPLIIYQDGEELAKVVEHQVFAHLGGTVMLYDRLRLGANLPLLVYHRGEKGEFGESTFATNDSTKLGDARFELDVRLFGEYRGPLTLAAGLQVFFPTGSRDAFSGDENLRAQPRVMAAGDLGPFTWAGRLGWHYRGLDEDFGGEAFGSELTFAAAAGVRALDDKLVVGPELFGSTVVSDSDGVFDRQTTPVELLFGGKYRVGGDVRLGAGAGPGLTRGAGSPAVRVVASVEWMPDVEEKKKAEEPPKKLELPPPAPTDRDGDGILDADDACPDERGIPSPDKAQHGCQPPLDKDGDRIIDPEDACPDEPGVATNDPKTNGCPKPADTDGDGIADYADACPNEQGPEDADAKKNGCPVAAITGTEIRILEQIQFDTGKATIKPESESVLQAVLQILKDVPDIQHVSVEGHTDNRAGKAFNVGLSKRRAAAVVKWLVDHGIDKGRLSSQGFGPDKPIAPNDSEEGRAKNRRVEFHIRQK